jgi:hypothetical protein
VPLARPIFDVPPGAASYRFEQEVVLPPQTLDLSTEVRAAWTFPSQHVAGSAPEVLPLPTVRFAPALDDHNRAPRVHALPAIIDRPAGATGALPRIARVSAEVSFDDGATWRRVPASTSTIAGSD